MVGDEKVQTVSEWVADEMAVRVGGRQFWLFNVMDADTRFVLSAYLSPERTTKAAAAALSMARERAANAPNTPKMDGPASYNQGVRIAFPVHQVKHVVMEGIRAVINNNLSERCKTPSGTATRCSEGCKRETGQTYLDGLVLHYNYFRPHGGLDGKRPAEAAGAAIPFTPWADVAAMHG